MAFDSDTTTRRRRGAMVQRRKLRGSAGRNVLYRRQSPEEDAISLPSTGIVSLTVTRVIPILPPTPTTASRSTISTPTPSRASTTPRPSSSSSSSTDRALPTIPISSSSSSTSVFSSTSSSSAADTSSSVQKGRGLSSGAVAGIAIAVVVVLAALITFLVRRRMIARRAEKREQWYGQGGFPPPPEMVRSNSAPPPSGFEIDASGIPTPFPLYTQPTPPPPPPFVMSERPGSLIPGRRGSDFSPSVLPLTFQAQPSAVPIAVPVVPPPPPPPASAPPPPPPQSPLGPSTNGTPSSRNAVVRCTFNPSMADELSISTGETIRVLLEYDDGWALCTNHKGRQGVVPLECLGGDVSDNSGVVSGDQAPGLQRGSSLRRQQ
ncbi:hypothetical protein V5O48_011823 [Marasmius crinis-equi]|uniref:SH3 domain-containing protein n=1 Tax=Marasmius crinis-equi TaxID=585013 RepID=A0ABR3F517_9AGAR